MKLSIIIPVYNEERTVAEVIKRVKKVKFPANISREVIVVNDASIDNVSAGVAVSGGNTQSGNDDGNTMTTGSSSGSSCSTNTANSNWTAIGGTLPEGGTSGCN